MDPNYSFYLHMENLKNSMYRQLSSARKSGLAWPKFYYNWFYANEKTYYNILNLRQKLGLEINEEEINSYNILRVNIYFLFFRRISHPQVHLFLLKEKLKLMMLNIQTLIGKERIIKNISMGHWPSEFSPFTF